MALTTVLRTNVLHCDEELDEAENMDLVKNDASAQKLTAETRATVSAVKRKYDYALQSTTVRARYTNEVLLITAGQDNYILDTFESYDTRTDQCRICHQHLLNRCYHGSCCLQGHVFLIGEKTDLEKLLQVNKHSGFTLSINKCHFAQSKVKFV